MEEVWQDRPYLSIPQASNRERSTTHLECRRGSRWWKMAEQTDFQYREGWEAALRQAGLDSRDYFPVDLLLPILGSLPTPGDLSTSSGVSH